MRHPALIALVFLSLLACGCSKQAAKAPDTATPGEIERLEELLGAHEIAFYERKPVDPVDRAQHAVSTTGNPLPFLVCVRLENDGQTIKGLICTGLVDNDDCKRLADVISRAVPLAVKSPNPDHLQQAIYDTLNGKTAESVPHGWSMTSSQPSDYRIAMLRRDSAVDKTNQRR